MKRSAVLAFFATVVALGAIGAWVTVRPDPDALWRIVSEQCVPAARSGAARNPCAKVDLDQGYVVFKDRNGIGQYLLMPTGRIDGIESPELVAPGARNYWRDAWEARSYLEQAIGTPLRREEIGLAVNSTSGRSQNHLHIHIDCMQPQVIAALAALKTTIGEQWTDLPMPLPGHSYRARLIRDGTLGETDPFQLLFADIQPRGEAMADQTLLLTGTTLADGRPAFLLLNDSVEPGDNASAEELQDHSCSVRTRHDSGQPRA
ncbi:CDP-diacylglycerol diphosphatase [Inquilinus limosus]|uniref:CDP-diacylglycerol pyrophosphatase n=1 Tax=Inquilinus limosus TaxID=171674 RepID=A0A211ZQZ7_9PROT|nr:CDP-diacylglycerol diphosphatase [Inquilinus limosus]OWJ67685.1 CDP-diacylglycerol diphosphatase [Inquilinus limosus]